MIVQLLSHLKNKPAELTQSQIFDEDTFYRVFMKDLNSCQSEVIIESPFVTNRRVAMLLPIFRKLKARRVKVIINTRYPDEHDNYLRNESLSAIALLQGIGVQVIYTESHHRKIAILDRNILWEGSLNILSQNNSREIMRRTESTALAWQVVRFTELDKLMN
jgi:phosphatidylserine/phosphatidylglycerophosphate/cardiolipin synthase-like enzyme